MFCPKCGTKNTDDARFCCNCGNSLSLEYPNRPVSPVTNVPPTHHKSKGLFVVGGIIFLAVIASALIFGIRATNENQLLQNVTTTISDNSDDDLAAYYDQHLPIAYADGGYMKECRYDQFHLTKGPDSNTFLLTGALFVTDLSLEERPSYKIGISGTVTTNFFRTEYSVSWDYEFEEPEARITDVSSVEDNGLLPSISLDTNWPLGYFEKKTGEAWEISYASGDDVFIFSFYSYGQKYYYDSPTWTEADFSFTVESLDVTSGAWMLRVDDTNITVMISDSGLSVFAGDIGGVSGNILTGTFYCKMQAIQP